MKATCMLCGMLAVTTFFLNPVSDNRFYFNSESTSAFSLTVMWLKFCREKIVLMEMMLSMVFLMMINMILMTLLLMTGIWYIDLSTNFAKLMYIHFSELLANSLISAE